MKKCFIYCLFLFISQFSFSQDLIVKISGDTISGEVIEVQSKYVVYRKPGKPKSTALVNLKTVKEVIYKGGRKEEFENAGDLILMKNGDSMYVRIRHVRLMDIIYQRNYSPSSLPRSVRLSEVEKVIYKNGKSFDTKPAGRDRIIMKNNDTIQGKILNAGKYSVYYKRFENSPEDSLPNYNLRKLIYADGTIQEINSVEYLDRNGEVRYKQKGADRLNPNRNRPLRNFFGKGFYLDFTAGIAGVKRVRPFATDSYQDDLPGAALSFEFQNYMTPCLGARIGHKFYFGNGNTYQPGLEVIWLDLGFHGGMYVSPLNLGFTNSFKLGSTNWEMHPSINAGATFIVNMGYQQVTVPGISYGGALKFRTSKMMFGLNCTVMEGDRILKGTILTENIFMINGSIGFYFKKEKTPAKGER